MWKFLSLILTINLLGYVQVQEPLNSSFPCTAREVPARDATLFCQVIGQGSPLVVLHGGPGLTQDYLLPQMAHLAAHNLVIFYDQRGNGRSTGEICEESMQFDPFIEDLETIRQDFGFDRISILGHSWGGLLAMKYALAHPEAVDRLVLLCSMPPSSTGNVDIYSATMCSIQESEAFVRQDGEEIGERYKELLSHFFFLPKQVDALTLQMTDKEAVNSVSIHRVFQQTIFSKPYDDHAQLKGLQIPTLIIQGASDQIPVSVAQTLHAAIAGSECVILENCGHFPYIEKSDDFFAVVKEFMQRESE